MPRKTPEQLMKLTKDGYDMSAKEFSDSRPFFWRELVEVTEEVNSNQSVLDLGCGNGRLYPLLKDKTKNYVGTDNSIGLLNIAQHRYPEATFVEASALQLPFPDESFDIVFSIAVLHHIPNKNNQRRFLKEIYRVLKPNGKVILTTWYLWEKHTIIDLLKYFVIHTAKNEHPELGDIILPLGKNGGRRFVHAFRVSELEHLLSQNGFNDNTIKTVPHGKANMNLLATAYKN